MAGDALGDLVATTFRDNWNNGVRTHNGLSKVITAALRENPDVVLGALGAVKVDDAEAFNVGHPEMPRIECDVYAFPRKVI